MVAVTHDTSNSAVGANVLTLSVGLTIAANSDRYLAVFIGASDSSAPPDISTATWNTTESIGELADSASLGNERVWGYGLKNPTATTSNVVITLSGLQDGLVLFASAFYNVDQTTPTGTVRTNDMAAIGGNDIWVAVNDGQANGVVVGTGLRALGSATANTIADVNGIPKFIASGALSTATAQTSRTPAMPANTLAGDLVIAHCASENNDTHSCATTGWNKLGQTNSGASWTVSHFWAIQTQAGISAPVITWTNSADGSARTHAFRDTKADGTPCAYLGTVGTGTGTTHTSTGGNTTANDSLAIYIDHCNANTGMAAEGGWTEKTDSGSSTGPVRTYLATKEIATSGTGSGNISETGGNAAWVQQQIEIFHADNGDQTNLAERESFGGDFASQSVAYETADTFNTLGWTGTSGTTGELFGIAWALHPTASTTLTAPKLSSGSTLRTHTVAPQIAATAPKIASTSALKNASISLTLVAPKIATASVLLAPTVAPQIAITAPKLASASVLRAPTVSFTLAAPKLASGSVLLAPTVTPVYVLTAPSLGSASTLRNATVGPVIALVSAKIATASALYGPSVSVESTEVSLSAPKLASGSVLRAPSLLLQIAATAPKIDSTGTLYGPSASFSFQAPLLASTSALYAPSVAPVITVGPDVLASSSAFYAPSLDVAGVTPPVVEPPAATGSTGGGPSNLFYRGRYRHELRRTILRAAGVLREAKSTRSRKRKARQVAKAIVEEFSLEPLVLEAADVVPPEFAKIENLRLQIFDLTLKLRERHAADAANTARLAQLFADYQAEAARLDRNEEEDAIMMIMAMAT